MAGAKCGATIVVRRSRSEHMESDKRAYRGLSGLTKQRRWTHTHADWCFSAYEDNPLTSIQHVLTKGLKLGQILMNEETNTHNHTFNCLRLHFDMSVYKNPSLCSTTTGVFIPCSCLHTGTYCIFIYSTYSVTFTHVVLCVLLLYMYLYEYYY